MTNEENFMKKYSKYIFEHKRLSIIKEGNDVSKTTIINKEINKITEDNKDLNSEQNEKIFICRTIFDSTFKDLEVTENFDIKNFTELKSSPFAEISQQIKKDILKIEDIKKSSKNMIYENNNMIIIKALIYLNKDDTIYSIENFKRRKPDLNKSKNEDDNKFERNVYIRIEDRLREYLNKIKLDKLSQLRNIETIYIQKILDFPKKSDNYKYICIKGIIIGLLNIINDLIGKEYLKLEEEQKNDEIEKGDFILEIFKKYDMIKTISNLIEKDFNIFIEE